MVIKTDALTDIATKIGRFPEFPPRGDMQNPIYLHRPSHMTGLALFLGEPETTFVLSEAPVGASVRDLANVRIPDLIVSYRCNPALVIEQRGYAIDSQGKPPDFVLEVAPVSTKLIDYKDKRLGYERFGIAEYWWFNPTGGEFCNAALAGNRLVNGRYAPIEIEWLDDVRCRGYSETLGLYVCWESEQLRWYEPESGSYLLTHEELATLRKQEEALRKQAKVRRERAEAELRRLRERLDAADGGG